MKYLSIIFTIGSLLLFSGISSAQILTPPDVEVVDEEPEDDKPVETEIELEVPPKPHPETPEQPGNDLPEIPEDESNGDFRTQTQGGWGSNPNGNNPGRFLHDNFNRAFPSGIYIGGGKSLRFTHAQAITDFLPSGGKSEALQESAVNPSKIGNNLAAQTLALTLSVGFDNSISSFGASNGKLGNLKLQKGTFQGWTVNRLLDEANVVLGGGNSAYSPSQINDALSKCNESFVDGKKNTGFLGGTPIATPSNHLPSQEGKPEKGKEKSEKPCKVQ